MSTTYGPRGWSARPDGVLVAVHGKEDRRHLKRLVWVSLLLAFGALLSLLLAACGAPSQQSFPGKVYASGDYRFSVVVPKGWADNEWRDPTPPAGTSGAPIPLTVIVTRAGSTQANNSLVSNLSIAILDLRHPSAVNADLLKVVTTRASNPAYHAVMLAGRTAYAAQPVLQDIYGSQQKATHTDYYLLTTSFEYHIGTDVLAGDNADDAIKSMLASFTLTP